MFFLVVTVVFSESEYILLDENENEIISGGMDDIRNYIENNL